MNKKWNAPLFRDPLYDGAAVSDDGGEYWYYRGALDLEFEFGHNTFWAPEVIFANGLSLVKRLQIVQVKDRMFSPSKEPIL